MVADELAVSLAAEHVPRGGSVFDPFCGSGRLLAASTQANDRVGFDVNPLACLVTRAKLAGACAEVVGEVARALSGRALPAVNDREPFKGEAMWFAPAAADELARIVSFLGSLDVPHAELLVVGAALSATVREVSFARQGGWKLHRLSEGDRDAFEARPLDRLARRLAYCRRELRGERLLGRSTVEMRDARRLSASHAGRFDTVLTSPPYGDSRTTVQYGAASALCLSVVSRLPGLRLEERPGIDIDRSCLGGVSTAGNVDVTGYWDGDPSTKEGRNVQRFLDDYASACETVTATLKPGGRAVVIVGRRSTGGHRLRLDDFTVDRLAKGRMCLTRRTERDMGYKRSPYRMNRFARCKDSARRAAGSVDAMSSETVLVLDMPVPEVAVTTRKRR